MHKPFEEGPKADIKRLQTDVKDLAVEINLISYHLESAWFQAKPNAMIFDINKALEKLEKVSSGLNKIKQNLIEIPKE